MHIDLARIPRGRVVPEPEDVCPRCHGRGWIVVADGGAGAARPCECQEASVVPRLLTLAGIPERYHRCTLENFNTDHKDEQVQALLVRAKRVSQQYVENFLQDDGSFCESGLAYVGPPGIGKTHLAAAVLAELIRKYRIKGRFVDFTSLIHQIRATFDPSSLESKHEVLDPVIEAEVLVFDELGAQKPTEWVLETLYFIINTRYTRRRATFFTTNYPLEAVPPPARAASTFVPGSDADVSRDGAVEAVKRRGAPAAFEPLASRVSASVVSRIFQMAQPLVMTGHDYRRTFKTPRIGS